MLARPSGGRIVERLVKTMRSYDISMRRVASPEQARVAATEENFDLHIVDFGLGETPALARLVRPECADDRAELRRLVVADFAIKTMAAGAGPLTSARSI